MGRDQTRFDLKPKEILMSQMVRLLFLILVSIACAVETRAVTAPSKSAKNVQGSVSAPVSHVGATTGPVKVTPVPMSPQELDTHIMPAEHLRTDVVCFP